jgi:signal transduction histidine kinase
METALDSKVDKKSTAARYALAVLIAVLALLLRQVLSPFFGAHNPYFTAWAGVVFSAWYLGLGESIATTLISLLGVWYWFLPSHGSFALRDPKAQITGFVGFLVLSAFIIALGEANRRSKARVGQAQAEVENQIQERTAELRVANKSLSQLSARLLQLQDEERRRLARELHDSVGQMLVAMKINIAAVQSEPLEPNLAKALAENDALTDRISAEIRTISHLLHPPLLDEAGLSSAIKCYVEEFSRRSKIAVNVDVAKDIGRLRNDVEIAIFRVVQESLTNIHRHSGSRTASFRLTKGDGHLRLEIKDAGKGIPIDKQVALNSAGQVGVGLRGMRERIVQLGGILEVQSDHNGTVVIASLPLQKESASVTCQRVA